jgi:hypothetical protein
VLTGLRERQQSLTDGVLAEAGVGDALRKQPAPGLASNPTRLEGSRNSLAYQGFPHRRGGDAMLHHRSLNPVLIRDWSRKMELFAGALDVCASVSFEARRTTEYLRPAPVSSPFLDTAVEPVPWPQRSGPRPPTGARPWLPHKKPKPFYGRGPFQSTSQRRTALSPVGVLRKCSHAYD